MASDPLQIKGVQSTTRHMDDIARRARDIKNASYAIRTIYRKSEEKRFQSRGGGSWPPLKESTHEYKARNNYDPRPMRATNALYRALTAPRARGQIDQRERDELRFGTDIPYARFHEAGKGVPRRVLINLTANERKDVDDAIADYIAKGEQR